MPNVLSFIKWALPHVDPASIPKGAVLPLPIEECGVDPVHYLLGTIWINTTQKLIWKIYEKNYASWLTTDQFADITKDWKPTERATDCQGLCDAYFSVAEGVPTDVNADYNYKYWCTDKGKISDISRPWVIGEAVFKYNASKKKMTHIGYICGFVNGEPLVLEAQGVYHGVKINQLSQRPEFTYRGLMTKKFDYTIEEEPGMPITPLVFEVVSPIHKGDDYKKMQEILVAANYPDTNGRPLEPDGKWGAKSQFAFESMISDYAEKLGLTKPTELVVDTEIPDIELSVDGRVVYTSRKE